MVDPSDSGSRVVDGARGTLPHRPGGRRSRNQDCRRADAAPAIGKKSSEKPRTTEAVVRATCSPHLRGVKRKTGARGQGLGFRAGTAGVRGRVRHCTVYRRHRAPQAKLDGVRGRTDGQSCESLNGARYRHRLPLRQPGLCSLRASPAVFLEKAKKKESKILQNEATMSNRISKSTRKTGQNEVKRSQTLSP
jgi:hypothetical protein